MSESHISVEGRLGRYDVYGEIAAGGMGTVHLAVQVGQGGIDRLVAIKRLHPELGRDPEFVEMLRNEARVLSRIRHSNVVAAHDAFELDDETFLVMDFIEGETLCQLAASQKAPMSPAIASAIVVGVLHGLASAHDATDHGGEKLGLVHRDISPHNVLVGFDGIARILDFGIARVANRVRETTRIFVNGKFGYMAPEQAQGIATHQSDLFSVGVVFWELLVGEKLRSGKSIQALATEIGATVPSPRSKRPELPAAFDDIFRRACALDPKDRYASALDMAHDIESALAIATQWEVARFIGDAAHEKREQSQELVRRVEQRYVSIRPPMLEAAAAEAGVAIISAGALPDVPEAEPVPPTTASKSGHAQPSNPVRVEDALPPPFEASMMGRPPQEGDDEEEMAMLADEDFFSLHERLDFSHEKTMQIDVAELSLIADLLGEATKVSRKSPVAKITMKEELPSPAALETSLSRSLASVMDLLGDAARDKGFAAAFDDEVTLRVQLRTGLADATQLKIPPHRRERIRQRPMPKDVPAAERYLVMRSVLDRPNLPTLALSEHPIPLVTRKAEAPAHSPQSEDTVRATPYAKKMPTPAPTMTTTQTRNIALAHVVAAPRPQGRAKKLVANKSKQRPSQPPPAP